MSIIYVIVITHKTNVYGRSRQVEDVQHYMSLLIPVVDIYGEFMNRRTKITYSTLLHLFWYNIINFHHGVTKCHLNTENATWYCLPSHILVCCNNVWTFVESADNYVQISTPAQLCITCFLHTSTKECYNYVLCFGYQLCFWYKLFISVVQIDIYIYIFRKCQRFAECTS